MSETDRLLRCLARAVSGAEEHGTVEQLMAHEGVDVAALELVVAGICANRGETADMANDYLGYLLLGIETGIQFERSRGEKMFLGQARPPEDFG